MSQNDFTIANQGFPAFRADLNSALQALATNNSGTSAPSTTFANQLFYDTTNNILKIRNEDNDAFISLFTLDQANDNIESLTINGAFTCGTFTSTGIDDNADAVAITINSSENVGISETSPLAKLHVKTADSGGSVNASADELVIEGSANSGITLLSGASNNGNIFFGDSGDDNVGRIAYAHSNNSFTFTTNGSNALTIDSSGNLGLGTSSPTSPSGFGTGGILHLKGSTGNDCSVVLEGLFSSGGRQEIGVSTGDLYFNRGGATGSMSTSMVIKSSGNVGINTTSPSTVLHVRGADATDTLTVGNTVENTQCTIRTHQDDRAVISATDGGTNRSLAFATGTTERARFDGASGNLLVGTSSSSNNLGRIVSNVNLASYHTAVFQNNTNNTGGLFLRLMNHANQDCGSISQTGTTTSAFAGSSDYRLKENIKYDFDGTSKIKQIKACEFNWIADGTDSTQEGFIAHELQDIVPSAVVGKKDEMETYIDDDGKEQTRPRYQGVDSSKIVPLLVKTIQELEARITTLEGA
jgi:hypothetical protein